MSRKYVVKPGDRLTRISTKHYGEPSKYPLIIQANPVLGERKLNNVLAADGLPIIYPGQILNIPDETIVIVNQVSIKEPSETIDTENNNSITLVIDGLSFEFFTGYSITSDIGSLDIVQIGSPLFDMEGYREVFQPLKYKTAAIYYGKNLFFNGILLAPQKQINPESETLSLNFYPKCGILQDCPIPLSAYPLEFNGLNLKQIAEKIAGIFGIKVEFIGDPGAAFEKVSLKPAEKPLSFIISLSKKRGFLVTNNIFGDLLIWKGEISEPVSFIKEGEIPFISCNPVFDPQNYYSSITGLTPETEKQESKSYIWENPFLTDVNRPTTIEINDIDVSDLKSSVEALAGRMFGNNKYPLILNTHLDGNNNLFQKNITIRTFSPKSSIYKETDFLIEKAVMSRQAGGGDVSQLSQVLPGAYTGQLPKEVPWEP